MSVIDWITSLGYILYQTDKAIWLNVVVYCMIIFIDLIDFLSVTRFNSTFNKIHSFCNFGKSCEVKLRENHGNWKRKFMELAYIRHLTLVSSFLPNRWWWELYNCPIWPYAHCCIKPTSRNWHWKLSHLQQN